MHESNGLLVPSRSERVEQENDLIVFALGKKYVARFSSSRQPANKWPSDRSALRVA